jgi:hypothetical protein
LHRGRRINDITCIYFWDVDSFLHWSIIPFLAGGQPLSAVALYILELGGFLGGALDRSEIRLDFVSIRTDSPWFCGSGKLHIPGNRLLVELDSNTTRKALK